MDKRIRDQVRAIESEGLSVAGVTPQGNSHFRVHVSAADGRSGYITIACSPSNGAGGGAFVARRKARQFNRSTNRR